MSGQTKRIAVYAGAFDPPAWHHRQIAERLTQQFDEVIIFPSGPRTDRPEAESVPIHRAVMIGPVSHGTVMGNICDVTGGLIGVKKAAGELGIGDPLVKHLDSTWDRQRAQIATDVTVIAISGAPTAGPGGIQDGDGFVQIDEIDLAKAKTVVLRGANPTPLAHLKEVGYSGVINQVGAALGQD